MIIVSLSGQQLRVPVPYKQVASESIGYLKEKKTYLRSQVFSGGTVPDDQVNLRLVSHAAAATFALLERAALEPCRWVAAAELVAGAVRAGSGGAGAGYRVDAAAGANIAGASG
jgi:hypothetical protein